MIFLMGSGGSEGSGGQMRQWHNGTRKYEAEVSDGNPRNIGGIPLNERIILHSGPIVFKFGLSVGPTLVWTLAVVDHQKSIFSI